MLPLAGAWVDAVKCVMCGALFAVAIWLLEGVLPLAVAMVLIAALMITAAIFRGALTNQLEGGSGWR